MKGVNISAPYAGVIGLSDFTITQNGIAKHDRERGLVDRFSFPVEAWPTKASITACLRRSYQSQYLYGEFL